VETVTVLDRRTDAAIGLKREEFGKTKLAKQATFVSHDLKGRRFDKWSIVLKATQEVFTTDGWKAIPNSGLTITFDSGQYVTDVKEIADALRACSDFGLRIHPHPLDPSGYWQEEGVLIPQTEEVKKLVLAPSGPRIGSGTKSVADTIGESNPTIPEPVESSTVGEPLSDEVVKRGPGRPPGGNRWRP